MSHMKMKREDYEHLLMAIANDLARISKMGVGGADKSKVRAVIGPLMTAAHDVVKLLEPYPGFGKEEVTLKKAVFGSKFEIESHSVSQYSNAA